MEEQKKKNTRSYIANKPFDLGHPLVRVGGEGDGGYLLPDILDGIKYCHLSRIDFRI